MKSCFKYNYFSDLSRLTAPLLSPDDFFVFFFPCHWSKTYIIACAFSFALYHTEAFIGDLDA